MWKMLMDLLHDADWKTELVSGKPLTLRIYHRFHGGDYSLMVKKVLYFRRRTGGENAD